MKNSQVKIAMIATNLKLNGITAVIKNYISYLNKNKYKITLVVGHGVAFKIRDYCKKHNIRIIELSPRKESPLKFYIQLYKTLIANKFDIVHVHGSNASIGAELLIAKFAGVKIRIAHSHNTTSTSMKIHKLMKPIFKSSYTNGFACGQLAGQWLFDNSKFTIIPNGIKISKFKFNNQIRNKVRKKLKLEGKFVIGHVGRFNYQKNHEFILEVFNEIYKINKEAVLILIGNGSDFYKIKEQAKTLSCFSNILFYGETNNVSSLYMAMDEFIFPSRFEGLPVTLIEAQTSGLPCVISDSITNEIKISDYLKFMSLNNSPKEWAIKLLNNKISVCDRNDFYNKYFSSISRYDIENDVHILEDKYDDIIGKTNNAK